MIRDHPAVPVVQQRLIAALQTLAASQQAMGQPVEAARAAGGRPMARQAAG